QICPVQGLRGQNHSLANTRCITCALVGIARQQYRRYLGRTMQSTKQSLEQFIFKTMIESLARGRPYYHDRVLELCAKVAQFPRKCGITFKLSQVDVLFDAIVAPNLRTSGTVAVEIFIRKSSRHDHGGRKAKRQVI